MAPHNKKKAVAPPRKINWESPTILTDLVLPPAQKAAESFDAYVRHVDPGFVFGELHRRLFPILEKWVRRQLPKRNIMMMLPVRIGKSRSCSQLLVPYSIGCRAGLGRVDQTLSVSYSSKLTSENNGYVRRILNSQEHGEVYPDILVDSQNTEDITFSRHGVEVAKVHYAGIEGGITGFGSHNLIIDDPVRGQEVAGSRVQRDTVMRIIETDCFSRLMDDYAICMIMSRWHPDDPAGRLIRKMREDPQAHQFHIICLPAVLDEAALVDPVYKMAQEDVLPDWRRAGEAICPERIPVEWYEPFKKYPAVWDSLYQQRPRSPETQKLNPTWFCGDRRIGKDDERLDRVFRWVRGIDLAVRAETSNDHTATARVGLTNDGYVILADLAVWRKTWPDSRRKILAMARADGARVELAFGTGGQQTGFIDWLRDEDPEFAPFCIHKVGEQAGKLMHAETWMNLAETGRILMVEGEWNQTWLQSVEDFTGQEDPFDDPLDAFYLAFQVLAVGSPGILVYKPPENEKDGKEDRDEKTLDKDAQFLGNNRDRFMNRGRRTFL